MRELLRSFEKGAGLGLGFFFIAALFIGVYAFVEPSSGPTADYYYDTESSIQSNNTLQYMGVTGAVTGNQGNFANVIDLCDDLYNGSRPATSEEIYALGNRYPYSTEVWVFPVGNTAAPFPGSANCYGFDSTAGNGYTIGVTGEMFSRTCVGARPFACVKGS